MVRDPRDIVVSGYNYHLWSTEKFLHVPKPRFRGKTYQEHLNSLSVEEGLAVEIERCNGIFSRMSDWSYDDERVLEFRYEDVFGNDQMLWSDLMSHWGMKGEAHQRGVEIGLHFSFEQSKRRDVASGKSQSHQAKGTPSQWQEVFTPSLVDLIEEKAGDLITKLGYR
jgi:hypothetical protein